MPNSDNVILAEDLARVRILDWAYQFNGGISKLIEALGVTEKIAVQEGTTLKALTVSGTLEDGAVPEGEVIPFSAYETDEVPVGEVTLMKWRKSTTAEAILKRGYEQAVSRTNKKMLRDIQNNIRTTFFGFFDDASGTTAATGESLQAALADAWGKLQVKWEDDAIETVYFVNPEDIADYLKTAQLSMQTAFGMRYVEDFLGLGTVFVNSTVAKGTFFATAKENVKMYYVDVKTPGLSAFNLTTDETGYIGINEKPTNDNATIENLVMSGVTFFPERYDGIVSGTIGADTGDEGAGGEDAGD